MEKIIRIDDHSGLVLEGGGMRGVFTCGVLDSFMDRGIRFPYTIGVSAGACNGLSYMSGQRGRAKYSNIDLLEKYNYIGLKYLLKKRNIMDFDLLFQEFPEHILPYDYEAYFHCPERYVMVTTNCETGEANYFEEKRSKERRFHLLYIRNIRYCVKPSTAAVLSIINSWSRWNGWKPPGKSL